MALMRLVPTARVKTPPSMRFVVKRRSSTRTPSSLRPRNEPEVDRSVRRGAPKKGSSHHESHRGGEYLRPARGSLDLSSPK